MKILPMKEYLAVSLLSQESPRLEMNLEMLIKKNKFFEMIAKAAVRESELVHTEEG